jgi:holin-like protein
VYNSFGKNVSILGLTNAFKGLRIKNRVPTIFGNTQRPEANAVKIICQIAIIFTICWISQIVEAILPFPFPASVIGMVLLLILLLVRALKVDHIREKSDFLLSNMAFFFIPAGVSIINYFDILASNLIPLLVICLVSTLLTFAVTAWAVRLTRYLMDRRKK